MRNQEKEYIYHTEQRWFSNGTSIQAVFFYPVTQYTITRIYIIPIHTRYIYIYILESTSANYIPKCAVPTFEMNQDFQK